MLLTTEGNGCSTIGRGVFVEIARSGLLALLERMNRFHSRPELLDEHSPLPLLSAALRTEPLSSSATGLYPPRMPEPTPLGLSSAEDRF